jgi:hypothetical protein
VTAEVVEEHQPAQAQQRADQGIQRDRGLGIGEIVPLQCMGDDGGGKMAAARP